jgi:GNAT superfamily N-acetyltransferase
MITIDKPTNSDISTIKNIMYQWTEKEEVEKYLIRIDNEIKGNIEFNLHFWVARENNDVLGIIGLCDPLPKIIPFSKTKKAGEIKILYVDGQQQGKGVGKSLISFVEQEAERQGYQELLVRSAKKYKDTAYGFYKKMGYSDIGTIINDKGKSMQLFEKLFDQ